MDFSPENTISEYLDLPLGTFLDLVASGNPAPGGGSVAAVAVALAAGLSGMAARLSAGQLADADGLAASADAARRRVDRKSTRLNSSHANISYAVFCLK